MNIKTYKVGISLLILLSILSIKPITELRFNFSVESLLPAAHPDVLFYKQFQQQFETDIDDEMTFISITNKSGVYKKPFLQKIDSLTKDLTSLPFVGKVYSLTNTNNIYFKNGKIEARPLIHISNPDVYYNDSIYLYESEYRQLMLSKSGNSHSIAVFIDNRLSNNQRDELFIAIKQKVEKLHFDAHHILNKRQAEVIYLAALRKDFIISGILFLLGVSLLLYFVYRSLLLLCYVISSIIVPNILIFGFIGILEIPLNGLSLFIPFILAVFGLQYTITFWQRLLRNDSVTINNKEVRKNDFNNGVKTNVFITLITSLLLFSLGFTSIMSLKAFGVVAGIGVWVSFICSRMFLPTVHPTSPACKIFQAHSADNFKKIRRYKLLILFFTLLSVSVSFLLIPKLQINSNLINDLPRNTTLIDDYAFIEKEYSGSRPLEVVFWLSDPKKTFYNLEILKKIDQIEYYLKDSFKAHFIVSPVVLYKGTNKAYTGGLNTNFVLPDSSYKIQRYHESIMQTPFGEEMKRHLSSDAKTLRISGKIPNCSGKEFAGLQNNFATFFNRSGFAKDISYKITGPAVLYDLVPSVFIKQIITPWALAFCLLIFLALFYYRNLILTLLFISVPLIASSVALAFMQSTGIYLKADTTITVFISFIIAVANTILFLDKIKKNEKSYKTQTNEHPTYLSPSLSMLLFFLCLCVGCIGLLFSDFDATVHFALLLIISTTVSQLLQLFLPPIFFQYNFSGVITEAHRNE